MVFKKRLDPDYDDFCKKVLARDNYTCQMPYCESKHNLIVHHIQPYAKSPFLRTDPENGICLCRKCHKMTFGKESVYAQIFLSVIKTKGENHGINSRKNRTGLR